MALSAARRPDSSRPTSELGKAAAFIERRLPFWEPQLVVLVAILIQYALPDTVRPLGPRWLLPALEFALLLGLVAISPHHRLHHSRLRRRFALGLTGLVSAANIVSLIALCQHLLQPAAQHAAANPGKQLIIAGAELWMTNVLLFGLWYWELDRGGPLARRERAPDQPDFLFPQMTDPRWAPPDWSPQLVDYLYVSFTNATAFSPTDAMPLSPMAKSLMSAQALVALVTVGLVVARAVNILG